MELKKVDFEKTNQFSKIFLDYIDESPQLKPFYGRQATRENFGEQIKEKSFSQEQRQLLHSVLLEQYQQLDKGDAVAENLKLLLDNNTYTITTGHQLNIFTGPLYFIYKIITVINACKFLKEQYPDKNFVPVYWMASEDHDFDEISYFRLNGQKIKLHTQQKGAVGRFNPSELKEILDNTPGIPDFFRSAYLKNKTLADAVREYVHHLFKEEGLIIIDADHPSLKASFSTIIEDDLFKHHANELVTKQSENLDKEGYKTQVFPREINFFYLNEGIRERIVKDGDQFIVNETDLTFSAEEMRKELKNHPERFSPNVIMRPLLQEYILPNLAYCGGPGELAYWFQLSSTFEHYNVPFPILLPRNFALCIPAHIHRKMQKADLNHENIFHPKHELMKEIALAHTHQKVVLNGEKDDLLSLFDKIKTMAEEIDPTLKDHVEAQQTITAKKLDTIEKKFIRAEKRNQSDRMRQIEDVLDYLFPNGGLQERTDNFLNFYLADSDFIKKLSAKLDPFDFRFNVFIDG